MSLTARGVGTTKPQVKGATHLTRRRRVSAASLFAVLGFALFVDVLAFEAWGPFGRPGDAGTTGGDGSPSEATAVQTLSSDYVSAEPFGVAGEDAEALAQEGEPASSVDGLLARLEAAEVVSGSSQATAWMPGEVPDVALAVLDAYRAESTRLLAYEGYLDLSGNVWGCVVEGEGWTDVAVVQAQGGGGSALNVTRMHVDAWAEDPDALLEEALDGS